MAKEDKDEYKGDKLSAPAGFDGPSNDRVCTDVLCSLLLVGMFAIMTAIGIYSIQNGDIRLILYPLDYDGNICGTNAGDIDMTDYPYLYLVNSFGGGVCMKECPSFSSGYADEYTLVTYGGVYKVDGLADESAPTVEMPDYSNSPNVQTCTQENCYPNNNPKESFTSSGVNSGMGYAFYLSDTTNYLNRCFISSDAYTVIEDAVEDTKDSITDLGAAEDVTSFISELYSDLYSAQNYILGFGFGVSVLASFLYTYLLRIPGLLFTLIWGSLLASLGLIGFMGYYSFTAANNAADEDPQVYSDDKIKGMRYFGYFMFVVAGLYFLFLCCLRKRIQLSIGIVKQASRAVQAMPTLLIFPVVQTVGLLAFIFVWLFYAVYVASLGEIETNEFDENGVTVMVRSFTYDDNTQAMAWILLFCFFWTVEFISAVGSIVIARAIASWYFTRDKGTIGTGTVVQSIRQSMWYHMGTAAFGALIIAIIQTIRAIVTYIQKKIEGIDGDNKAVKCVACCCQCCFACLEKCMRFINKHAYIQTAIFSTNFCESAKNGFLLILRNFARIGAVAFVSEVVVVIGKVFIAAATGTLAYIFMERDISHKVESVIGPVVVVMILTYVVATLFFSIFSMAVDTVLQCFIADEEMFDGDDCYAEGSLKEWIDDNGS
mmetsp:Transcript_5580/g.8197  ORF Transcript_5580/g.8197 Transcript_5580/m.8197 type:complete len:658 (-) Transcript_5580:1234-3207(-)